MPHGNEAITEYTAITTYSSLDVSEVMDVSEATPADKNKKITKTFLANNLFGGEKFSFGAPTELTIAAGVITPTQTRHTVDTEADAATDDLVTITAGADGDVVILTPENAARVVTIKQTGNIELYGANFALDSLEDLVVLMYDTLNATWFAIAVRVKV